MLAWLVNTIIKFLLQFLLRIDAAELDQVPDQGPILAVANHINFLDAPVIITYLQPRQVTGLVKKESWDNPMMAFLFNVWGGIPIDRSIADFTAFKQAKQALNDGKILAVAPEGTRSEDGRLGRGKPGIAILASQVDAPIYPIAYYGHENFNENIRRLKRSPMEVRVGKPFRIKFAGQQKNKAFLQTIADVIMLEIADLMPEKYHGAYAQFSIDKDAYLEYLD